MAVDQTYWAMKAYLGVFVNDSWRRRYALDRGGSARGRSKMIGVDVVMRRENGKPIQAAPIVRSLRGVRRGSIRQVGVTESRNAHGAVITTRAAAIEPRNSIAKVFRGNEVMQMGIRALIEQGCNLLPARDRRSCSNRSRRQVTIERTHIRTVGRRVLNQHHIDVGARIGRRNEDRPVGDRIYGGIGRAGFTNVFG